MTRPVDVNLPMFFNVDTSVGKAGRNSSPEDILLVQFLLQVTAGAATAKDAAGEARRQRVLKVPVTGIADAATMDGIHAWQEGRKLNLSDDRRWAHRSGARRLLCEERRVDDRGLECRIPRLLPEDLAAAAGSSEMPGRAEDARGSGALSRTEP
jgi:hypothetical protein